MVKTQQLKKRITTADPSSQGNDNNPFNGPSSRSTQVSRYQKNIHPLTSCHYGYHITSLINFLHFLQCTESSLHICWVWQSFSITSLPSFHWPISRSYTCHFIIRAFFSPNHFRPFLKHAYNILTYIAAPL